MMFLSLPGMVGHKVQCFPKAGLVFIVSGKAGVSSGHGAAG